MEMRVGGRAGALVRAGVEKTTAIVGTRKVKTICLLKNQRQNVTWGMLGQKKNLEWMETR